VGGDWEDYARYLEGRLKGALSGKAKAPKEECVLFVGRKAD